MTISAAGMAPGGNLPKSGSGSAGDMVSSNSPAGKEKAQRGKALKSHVQVVAGEQHSKQELEKP